LGLVQGSVHEEQFLSVPGHKDYRITGWAKTDELVLLDPISTREGVVRDFKLDPNKKIILFSPTYNIPIWEPLPNACGHLARKVYEALGGKYNLLFCPHELDNWKEDTKGLPNVIRMSNKNRLLVAADMMIGDRSSIMSEFLVLEKPQIHLWNTVEQDTLVPHLWGKKENERVGFGPRTSVSNLAEVVESLFADPTLFAQERAYWKHKIFYKPDGHAAERVADAIEDYTKCRR
jgi:CDP-glycerol glycerophosphotransferase (TagB/SpsB family)